MPVQGERERERQRGGGGLGERERESSGVQNRLTLGASGVQWGVFWQK